MKIKLGIRFLVLPKANFFFRLLPSLAEAAFVHITYLLRVYTNIFWYLYTNILDKPSSSIFKIYVLSFHFILNLLAHLSHLFSSIKIKLFLQMSSARFFTCLIISNLKKRKEIKRVKVRMHLNLHKELCRLDGEVFNLDLDAVFRFFCKMLMCRETLGEGKQHFWERQRSSHI